jgi:hypothetical protein
MFCLLFLIVNIPSKNKIKNLHRVTEAEDVALFYHCSVFYRLKGSCMNFMGSVV